MAGRIRALGRRLRRVDDAQLSGAELTGWEFRSVPADSVGRPQDLPDAGWMPATLPTTAAAALRAANAFSLDGTPVRFDEDDWWWRVRFPGQAGESASLVFEGLATLAEVWLNGAPVLTSDNMFLAHECPVVLSAENQLALRFRAVDKALAARRPRPRWRAPMVEHQQLRWVRATLLGRTPGWSPAVAAVGPWRPVRLERRGHAHLEEVRISSRLADGKGIVDVVCTLIPGDSPPDATSCDTTDWDHWRPLPRPADESASPSSATIRADCLLRRPSDAQPLRRTTAVSSHVVHTK